MIPIIPNHVIKFIPADRQHISRIPFCSWQYYIFRIFVMSARAWDQMMFMGSAKH